MAACTSLVSKYLIAFVDETGAPCICQERRQIGRRLDPIQHHAYSIGNELVTFDPVVAFQLVHLVLVANCRWSQHPRAQQANHWAPFSAVFTEVTRRPDSVGVLGRVEYVVRDCAGHSLNKCFRIRAQHAGHAISKSENLVAQLFSLRRISLGGRRVVHYDIRIVSRGNGRIHAFLFPEYEFGGLATTVAAEGDELTDIESVSPDIVVSVRCVEHYTVVVEGPVPVREKGGELKGIVEAVRGVIGESPREQEEPAVDLPLYVIRVIGVVVFDVVSPGNGIVQSCPDRYIMMNHRTACRTCLCKPCNCIG